MASALIVTLPDEPVLMTTTTVSFLFSAISPIKLKLQPCVVFVALNLPLKLATISALPALKIISGSIAGSAPQKVALTIYFIPMKYVEFGTNSSGVSILTEMSGSPKSNNAEAVLVEIIPMNSKLAMITRGFSLFMTNYLNF